MASICWWRQKVDIPTSCWLEVVGRVLQRIAKALKDDDTVNKAVVGRLIHSIVLCQSLCLFVILMMLCDCMSSLAVLKAQEA